MQILISTILSLVILVAGSIGVYNYIPLDYFDILKIESNSNQKFSSTITTIQGTDTISGSRTTINNNFSALNSGKIEISTTSLPLLTSASSLSTVGTITTGVWNATTLTVSKGGTGSTTLSAYNVLIGSSTNAIGIVAGLGTTGQFLTSQGASLPPNWTTSSVDLGIDYSWTGGHTFVRATTTYATSTNLTVSGTASTSALVVSTTLNGYFVGTNMKYASSTSYIVQSADTERTSDETSPTKVKEITITQDGEFVVAFDLKGVEGQNAKGRVYRDGLAIGVLRNNPTASYITYYETFILSASSTSANSQTLLQLYFYSDGYAGSPDVYVRNFRIYGRPYLNYFIVNTD